MDGTEVPLAFLLARLTEWMPITDFDALMQRYFKGNRSQAEIADYRAKRGAVKPIRDEVSPVLSHLRFVKAKGEVRFALNNTVPDCWLRDFPEAEPRGMEVTAALAREQHHLGRELNEKRIGRGFLGLQDTASSAAFAERLAKPRIMYSSASPLKAVADGIKFCLQKKAKPTYAGLDLLIEAPLDSLPHERWSQIEDELRAAAKTMPFREVHVIGNHKPFGFRIK
jgi:hypothetical protein